MLKLDTGEIFYIGQISFNEMKLTFSTKNNKLTFIKKNNCIDIIAGREVILIKDTNGVLFLYNENEKLVEISSKILLQTKNIKFINNNFYFLNKIDENIQLIEFYNKRSKKISLKDYKVNSYVTDINANFNLIENPYHCTFLTFCIDDKQINIKNDNRHSELSINLNHNSNEQNENISYVIDNRSRIFPINDTEDHMYVKHNKVSPSNYKMQKIYSLIEEMSVLPKKTKNKSMEHSKEVGYRLDNLLNDDQVSFLANAINKTKIQSQDKIENIKYSSRKNTINQTNSIHTINVSPNSQIFQNKLNQKSVPRLKDQSYSQVYKTNIQNQNSVKNNNIKSIQTLSRNDFSNQLKNSKESFTRSNKSSTIDKSSLYFNNNMSGGNSLDEKIKNVSFSNVEIIDNNSQTVLKKNKENKIENFELILSGSEAHIHNRTRSQQYQTIDLNMIKRQEFTLNNLNERKIIKKSSNNFLNNKTLSLDNSIKNNSNISPTNITGPYVKKFIKNKNVLNKKSETPIRLIQPNPNSPKKNHKNNNISFKQSENKEELQIDQSEYTILHTKSSEKNDNSIKRKVTSPYKNSLLSKNYNCKEKLKTNEIIKVVKSANTFCKSLNTLNMNLYARNMKSNQIKNISIDLLSPKKKENISLISNSNFYINKNKSENKKSIIELFTKKARETFSSNLNNISTLQNCKKEEKHKRSHSVKSYVNNEKFNFFNSNNYLK